MGRGLLSLLPETSPLTYLILGVNSLLFLASLMATVSATHSLGLFGGIRGDVLLRLGARQSLLIFEGEVWRLVMPIFLHGSLMHFAMNTWVLIDLGPQLEEVYGSARYLFLYVATGILGFLSSTAWSLRYGGGGISIGASGALMGMIGLMLAIAMRRGGAAMRALRAQLLRWVLYIFILGFVIPGTDNAAHLGGLTAGFLLGKIFADREPLTAEERKRAYALGGLAALVVVASFAAMLADFFKAG
jgi:rhomboid protease GluP